MANQMDGNPLVIDTAVSDNKMRFIKAIQWISDAGDFVDGDSLTIKLNGVSFTVTLDRAATPVGPGTAWEVGPFSPPFAANDSAVTTIDRGAVLVWLA